MWAGFTLTTIEWRVTYVFFLQKDGFMCTRTSYIYIYIVLQIRINTEQWAPHGLPIGHLLSNCWFSMWLIQIHAIAVGCHEIFMDPSKWFQFLPKSGRFSKDIDWSDSNWKKLQYSTHIRVVMTSALACVVCVLLAPFCPMSHCHNSSHFTT